MSLPHIFVEISRFSFLCLSFYAPVFQLRPRVATVMEKSEKNILFFNVGKKSENLDKLREILNQGIYFRLAIRFPKSFTAQQR